MTFSWNNRYKISLTLDQNIVIDKPSSRRAKLHYISILVSNLYNSSLVQSKVTDEWSSATSTFLLNSH